MFVKTWLILNKKQAKRQICFTLYAFILDKILKKRSKLKTSKIWKIKFQFGFSHRKTSMKLTFWFSNVNHKNYVLNAIKSKLWVRSCFNGIILWYAIISELGRLDYLNHDGPDSRLNTKLLLKSLTFE